MEEVKKETPIPLGQMLIKEGYTLISDLTAELKCEEILEREFSDFIAPIFVAGIQDDHKDAKITNVALIKSKSSAGVPLLHARIYFEYPGGDHSSNSKKENSCRSTNSFFCTPKVVDLNDFIVCEIPDRGLFEIEKAKSLGLSVFKVAFPVIENISQTNIIIFAQLGEEMIKIFQW